MSKGLEAFADVPRSKEKYRPVDERIKDFCEVEVFLDRGASSLQASRCMECGVPFCNYNCPLGNNIPEINELIHNNRWKEAYELYRFTNPFPEFTGKLCPAPCEDGCVLAISGGAVNIRLGEACVADIAFSEGYAHPLMPKVRFKSKVAVVGSGPAGLASAFILNQYGHNVTVFEKNDKVGGLLRYGVPDFKMDKAVIDRRVDILAEEGITFKTGVEVGKDISFRKIRHSFDAVVLAAGCGVPKDLAVPGRELQNVHFAMDYLTQANKRVAGEKIVGKNIDVKGKTAVVIGIGDTGSDCVGTLNREGASEVIQIYYKPKPPSERTEKYPWPTVPRLYKKTSSYEEGVKHVWSLNVKEFRGEDGILKQVVGCKTEWAEKAGSLKMTEMPWAETVINADLAFIAMGYIGTECTSIMNEYSITTDEYNNIKTDKHYRTNVEKVFAAGDARIGQSLIVDAMADAISCAKSVDAFLKRSCAAL